MSSPIRPWMLKVLRYHFPFFSINFLLSWDLCRESYGLKRREEATPYVYLALCDWKMVFLAPKVAAPLTIARSGCWLTTTLVVVLLKFSLRLSIRIGHRAKPPQPQSSSDLSEIFHSVKIHPSTLPQSVELALGRKTS